jgi:hypothetical protein
MIQRRSRFQGILRPGFSASDGCVKEVKGKQSEKAGRPWTLDGTIATRRIIAVKSLRESPHDQIDGSNRFKLKGRVNG